MSNPQRGNTRIEGLLGQLGLEGRLVSDADLKEPVDNVIDWKEVYSSLDHYRNKSIEFLAGSLDK